MRVFAATVEDLKRSWTRFSPLLARYEIETQLTSLEQFRRALLAEQQQLWGLQDSLIHLVCVTEILETPKGKVCLIAAGCGKAPVSEMRKLFETIKGWAKSIGCTFVRVMGREGWARALHIPTVGRVMECPL